MVSFTVMLSAHQGGVLVGGLIPDERSGIWDQPGYFGPRISRSLSSGAHSRDPLAHAGYPRMRALAGTTRA